MPALQPRGRVPSLRRGALGCPWGGSRSCSAGGASPVAPEAESVRASRGGGPRGCWARPWSGVSRSGPRRAVMATRRPQHPCGESRVRVLRAPLGGSGHRPLRPASGPGWAPRGLLCRGSGGLSGQETPLPMGLTVHSATRTCPIPAFAGHLPVMCRKHSRCFPNSPIALHGWPASVRWGFLRTCPSTQKSPF